MKGKYHIRVENRRIQYDLDIRRNITVIRGDSATGKTTLIGMLQNFERDGVASGIRVICERPCVVLDGPRWQDNLKAISGSIVFADEDNRFIESKEFAELIKDSDNYYVLISRSKLGNLPYSVEEIYGIHESGKFRDLKKTYNELYQIYQKSSAFEKPEYLLIEDSNSGYVPAV